MPLNVFITVDTEVWPLLSNWRKAGLSRDIDRDIYGRTPWGCYGVSYQLDLLSRHGLTGVFLVEPLFADVAGIGPLCALIDEIRDKKHEVQAHIHPEWLAWMDNTLLPGRPGELMKDFSEDDQAVLIERALNNLRAAGADNVCAFRAGDYAADHRTLRALARNNIAYDTSHNTCYLNTRCGLAAEGALQHPKQIEGVYEFPVTVFSDWPGHFRHAQLTACSFAELRTALIQAWEDGWYSFVIVSHSFELLKRRRKNPANPRPDPVVIQRFEKLCQFLGENPDKFRTRGFADLAPESIPAGRPARRLRSSLRHTVGRIAGQLVRRLS